MRRALALALAGALVLAACSSDEPERSELSLEPSTTTTTDPATAELATLLPTTLGDRLQPADDVLGTGPLDLAAAAEAGTDPTAERAVLEEHGFERGVSRAWAAPPADTVYVVLYEFVDAEGAAAYHEAQVRDLERRGATEVPRHGLDQGRAFTTQEGKLTTHAVLFQQGRRWVLALAASESGAFTPDDPTDLVAELAARL